MERSGTLKAFVRRGYEAKVQDSEKGGLWPSLFMHEMLSDGKGELFGPSCECSLAFLIDPG